MNQQTEASIPSEPSGSPRFMYQEYWVDFLGGLLPGALFSVVGLYILIPSFLLVVNIFEGSQPTGLLSLLKGVIESTKETPNMIWIGLSIVLISFSYVLGHIFYRQDPNYPNQKSLKRLAKKHISRDNNKIYDSEQMKNKFGCESIDKCEFPYRHFKQYLNHRGLTHLGSLAVWCEDETYRTKNYINILKARIRFHFPNHCSTIIRNEAHIRLATSVWYVGKAIVKISFIAFGIFACVLLAKYFFSPLGGYSILTSASNASYVVALFTIFTGGYLGYYMRTHVEDFLHCQRQREILYVLEIAWIAFSEKPKLLKPPFNNFTGKEQVDTEKKDETTSEEIKNKMSKSA